MTTENSRIKSIIESLIFVSETPLPLAKIRAVLDDMPTRELKQILDEMKDESRSDGRGVYLDEVASGYQYRTNPENADWIKRLVEQKPTRLSKAALETLAIVAYNQPITKPEVENIRGVDSTSAVGMLVEKKLVRILGRKDVPGKPLIYGTTSEFLEIFNLMDLSSLPTLKEIESLGSEDAEEFRMVGDPAPDGEEDRQLELMPEGAPDDENAAGVESAIEIEPDGDGDDDAKEPHADGDDETDDDEFEDDDEFADDDDDEDEDEDENEDGADTGDGDADDGPEED
ncbi:MAG: SMC-Scp complex subunit ScpB [Deltaproteobacteria bacterium]|nr:SMC-Scp complex subunit ScpB [Deltaproteobacteria bacterium]